MMKRIFEILSMVTLLVWGAMFLYFFFSGRINDLLTENFRPWVLLAGLALLGLGLFNLINHDKSTGACSHDHTHGDHTHCEHDHDHTYCDHDHGHHPSKECDHEHHHHDHDHSHPHDHDHSHPHDHDDYSASSLAFALAVLLVPLLTAAKFSDEKFSKEYTQKWVEIEHQMQRLRQRQAADNQKATTTSTANPYTAPGGTTANTGQKADPAWGEFTLADLKKMVPQTSAGDFLLDVPQIYYTAGDQELMKVMEGISVDTTAQIIEDTVENAPAKRLRAYRLLIDCCAADARPLSIPIDFAEALPEYKEMGWYKLVGRLHFHKSADSEYTPILQIKNFQTTPEPPDWMGY
jgi:hypothetical protein